MTAANTPVLVAALRASIKAEHPEETPREHEIRLANALRGLLEERPVAYDAELYPEAVRQLVPDVASPAGVVIEPAPEPELDQTDLANSLVEAVRADVAYVAADAAFTRVCAHLGGKKLRARLGGTNDPDQGRWVSHRAEEHLRRVVRDATDQALVEVVEGLIFTSAPQAHPWRVY